MSEYIAKASIEPRDYRVVFLIQKKRLLSIKEAASSDWYTMDITDTSVSHFSRL